VSAPPQRPRTGQRARRTLPAVPDPRRRVALLLGVFVIVGGILFGVLAELQAVRPERYRALGEQQLQRRVTIDGYRGAVRDRDGFVLAMSTQSYQLVVDPTLIADPAATAALLAPVLGSDAGELAQTLTRTGDNDRYRLLGRHLPYERADALGALLDEHRREMVGVFVLPDEQRVNPAGRLAANLVGATDPDLRGVSGIEAMYDEDLTGIDGFASFEGGRFGSISVGNRVVQPASAGADIVLTIDHRLQYVVDQALIEHCEAVEANGASAAISDPRTGELLALSSVVRDADGVCAVPGANMALLDTYEPGSVLKVVTLAGAVEELGLDKDSDFEIPPYALVGNKAFRDDHPLRPAEVPLWKVLAASSNVGTITLAQELGPDRLYGYLRDFGFGSPTGIGFIGEADGRVRAPADWWGSDMGSMTIGQGITVNVVQMLAAYNVIANGGTYVAPSLVRSVVEPGEEPTSGPRVTRQVVSADTAAQVSDMLTKVVTEGTGGSAAIPGYEVAGKTGTAWKAVPNADGMIRYLDDDGRRRYVVSFAGFVPADDPQLSMVVTVDEPRTQTTASAVAAPVFASIMQHALRIMGIPPTTTVDEATTELVRGTPAGGPADDAVEVIGAPAPASHAAQAAEDAERADTDADADADADVVPAGAAEAAAAGGAGRDEAALGGGPAGAQP
jgi:cell division protein FtsI (penicillin-binding protein 3)